MTRKFQTFFVATLAMAALAGPAMAAETRREAVEVRYGDLNLRSEEGAERLLSRLNRAAREACGIDPWAQEPVRQSQRRCQERALGRSVEKVGAPLLTQIYAAREGRRAVFAAR